MASIELSNNRKFFVFSDPYRSKSGTTGSLWLIDSSVDANLVLKGVDAVLENPSTENKAAICIVAHIEKGERPGLLIDYYNDPMFGTEEGIAFGVIDRLGNADKRDPMLGRVREMVRNLMQVRADDLSEGEARYLWVHNSFFEDVKDPEKITKVIFEGYHYNHTSSDEHSDSKNVRIAFPIDQFLE